MKGLQIGRHGGPEAIETVDLPEPVAGPDEVLVRIGAVGLNHLDVWVRRGVDGHKFPLPLIPGSDAAGWRVDTGELVALAPMSACMACRRCIEGRHDLCRQFRIRGEGQDGYLREIVAVHKSLLLPAWEGATVAELGGTALALLTAYHALTRAGVGAGQRIVVVGGAGGVGHLAIQVARALGGRVLAIASTPEKREVCLGLGAEVAVDAASAVKAVKTWTGGELADVVLDSSGAATFADSLRMLRWGGAYATYGATSGHEVELDLRALFFKQLRLIGATMGSFSDLAAAWELARTGRVKVRVDSEWDWARIAEAHARIEDRGAIGKVVVRIGAG